MDTSRVKTFGCRINSYESELIREIIKDSPECLVVNTCTVTAEAHRQCLQSVRKLRRENPQAKIIVTGCAATVAPGDFQETADVVISNENKLEPESYVAGAGRAPFLITGFEGRNRAFMQVQQGCGFKCTYCIVPRARGGSRSVPYGKIREQLARLLDNGAREIVLTGINLSDYEGGVAALTHNIFKDFGDIRLRYGSLDPAAVDDGLVAMFADTRLLPHIHLSIQAGDDLILKRMGRRHSRETVLGLAKKLRAVRAEIMIGADFITGFPTETEKQFTNTLTLLEEAGISMLHVFPYSERPGTPAAKMPAVDKSVRKGRAAALRDKGLQMLKKELDNRVGKILNILFESDEKGHSDEYIMVHANGKKGKILPVRITSVSDGGLMGEVV